MEAKLAVIIEMIDNLVSDNTVPKNIRKILTDSKDRLNGPEDIDVKISAAIYLIESISDDINMPSHARTQIWAIMSALEGIKQG